MWQTRTCAPAGCSTESRCVASGSCVTTTTISTTTTLSCVRANPTVTVTPSPQSGNPGQGLSYAISVRNNDAAGCGSSAFSFSATPCPAGFTCSSLSSLSVSPGSTGQRTATVTSPIPRAAGANVFTYRAANSGASGFFGSGSATYTVNNVAPTLNSVTSNPSVVSAGSTITITSSAADNNGDNLRIQCGTASATTNNLCNPGTFVASNPSCSFNSNLLPAGDGTKTIYCLVADTSGLQSSVLSTTVGSDNLPPTSSVTAPPANSWRNETFTATLSYSDSGSGLSSCEYSIQKRLVGGGWSDVIGFTSAGACSGLSSNLARQVTVGSTSQCNQQSIDGSTTTCRILTRGEDVAGNLEIPTETEYFIDYSPPVLIANHFPSSPVYFLDSATITSISADSGGSGLQSIRIIVDGIEKTSCPSSPCAYTSTYPVGIHTYSVISQDNAGNVAIVTDSFEISSRYVVINVDYPFVRNRVVSVIPSGGECTNTKGCPNFVRTMPIEFTARAEIRDSQGRIEKNPAIDLLVVTCNGATCNLSSRISSASWHPLVFSQAFIGTEQSGNLQCDTFLDLEIFVNSTLASGIGTNRIYLNCIQQLTVEPNTIRIALGEKNIPSFRVSFWNPESTHKNLALRMESSHPLVIKAGNLRCVTSGPNCFYQDTMNDDRVQMSIAPSSSNHVIVDLSETASSRAGTYEITFIGTGSEYTATANLIVFAEALDDFQLWQLLVMMISAIAILIYFYRKG